MKKVKNRNFSLVTYLTEQQIKAVIEKHNNQVKAYAYILHDKDITEEGSSKKNHYHLLIALVNATSISGIKKWFSGFTDSTGMEVNTMCQITNDICGSFDYLTHNTEGAKLDGKYLYNDSEVKGFNLEYFKDISLQNVDNLTLALQEMFEGVPLEEIFKKYGRDFIIHYGHIKDLFNDIQNQYVR